MKPLAERIEYTGAVDAKEVRFAVGQPDGRRSATFRFWRGPDGDLYLAARSLGGIIKMSFHASGQCHLAFTKDYHGREAGRKSWLPESRFVERWNLVEPVKATPRLLAQVVVPESELRVYTPTVETRPGKPKRIAWIPAAAIGWATEFSLLLHEPPEGYELRHGWPTMGDMGTTLLAYTELPQRRIAWLLVREFELNETGPSIVTKARERAAELAQKNAVKKEAGTRNIVWGRNVDGRRWFLDLAWQ